MSWFAKVVRRKLERRGLRVVESGDFTFEFISTNLKGKKMGVKCKPHGHIYKHEKKRLLNSCHRLGLDGVYVASEKYVADLGVHEIKIKILR